MSLANQIRKKLLIFTDIEIHKIQKRSEKNKDFIFQNNKNKTASPITVTYEETFSFNNVADQTTVVISSNNHQRHNSICSFYDKCSNSNSTDDFSNNSYFVENKNLSPNKSKRKKTASNLLNEKYIQNLRTDKKHRTVSLHEGKNLVKCTENILNVISNKKKQNEDSLKYLKNLCKSFKIPKKTKTVTKKKNNWHLIPVTKKTQEKINKRNKRRSEDKICFFKKK